MSYTTVLQNKYEKEVLPAMKEKFAYKNVMEVPKLLKICLNQGVGEAVSDKEIS